MHGNVWEWCEDNWHDNYQGAPSDGSPWINGNHKRKVLRGGAWLNIGSFCRSAYRLKYTPDSYLTSFGFRLSLFAENSP
jgi:formylglycine-generating enzyme required for sulfatase activity